MIWVKSSIFLLFISVSLNGMFGRFFQHTAKRSYQYTEQYNTAEKKDIHHKIALYKNVFKASQSKLINRLHMYKTLQTLVNSAKIKARAEQAIFSNVYANAKKNNRFKKKISFVYDEPKHEKPRTNFEANEYVLSILASYKINAQEVSIMYNKDGMYEGCSVFAKEVYKNKVHNNQEKYIKIMLCIDEQQCIDYGFAYLIAHEAMHIKYRDMEYVYGLNKKIEHAVFTKYLQAIELRADMATLDSEDYLITDNFRKEIITQALYMHVQRLPNIEKLRVRPELWDIRSPESTHPTSLERFAYFTRAQELL